jgi:cobalamin synthase
MFSICMVMKILFNISVQQLPSGRRLWRLTALAMAMAMFCAVLLIAFHHHADDGDHDDCAICSVAHHRPADTALTFPNLTYLPFSFPACFATVILILVVTRYCHLPQNRAPPARCPSYHL